MTKAELIAALAGFPDDARVVVNGYEDGYDDPVIEGPYRLRLASQNSGYVGAYYKLRVETLRLHGDFKAVVIGGGA